MTTSGTRTATILGRGHGVCARVVSVVLLLVCLLGAPAWAGGESKEDLERRWVEALGRGQADDAGAIIERMLERWPADFLLHYNLACVRVAQGKLEEAEKALAQAVACDFADYASMARDEHLAPLRDSETYRSLIDRAAEFQDAVIERRIERYRHGFAARYAVERDEGRRIAYLSGLDPLAFAQAREELDKLAVWWETTFPPDAPTPAAMNLDRRDAIPHPWVLVVLPDRARYEQWAKKNFGDGWETKGGIYDHDRKELVARDLGATLRHEFLHVLHWRDMNDRGQVHRTWVQEGLCSLVEDVRWDGAALEPVPSWRTNQLKRLAAASSPPRWKELFAMSPERFVGDRPLAHYAASRAVFMYLHQQGRLGAWYTAYTRLWAIDPSGAGAMEEVFAQPLDKSERQWRAWIKDLPEVREEGHAGGAVLPFTLGQERGDGIVIASGGGPLLARDVLTHIDDQPVGDGADVARLLTGKQPGDAVVVGFRRGREARSAQVRLVRPPAER